MYQLVFHIRFKWHFSQGSLPQAFQLTVISAFSFLNTLNNTFFVCIICVHISFFLNQIVHAKARIITNASLCLQAPIQWIQVAAKYIG